MLPTSPKSDQLCRNAATSVRRRVVRSTKQRQSHATWTAIGQASIAPGVINLVSGRRRHRRIASSRSRPTRADTLNKACLQPSSASGNTFNAAFFASDSSRREAITVWCAAYV
jgi:hypothetical protein